MVHSLTIRSSCSWSIWTGIILSSLLFATASEVYDLNTDLFKDFIQGHELVLVEFVTSGCGLCETLAPEYEEAAAMLKKSDIPCVKVNCLEEKSICSECGVETYPGFRVFRGLANVRPYEGKIQAPAIISYMTKFALPTVSIFDMDSLEELKTLTEPIVVGFFASEDKARIETFTMVAESLRGEYYFGVSNTASFAEVEGVSQPAIVQYTAFDRDKSCFEGKFDTESIQNFVKSSKFPLVGEVTPGTYMDYKKAGIPLAYIFAETAEERQKLATELIPVARKYRGTVNFAVMDAQKFGYHAEEVALEGAEWPAFTIHNMVKNQKFPLRMTSFTELTIATFVQDVPDGKVKPTIKSQPLPKAQEGPVYVVVAHNYEDIVMDDERDVLLEYYSPRCIHCEAETPLYEEVGSLYHYNAEFSRKVAIAKVDTTNNDLPEEIYIVPTIKLFPAGNKGNPLDYVGQRTVKDIANFIRENGTHHVNAYVRGTEKLATNDDAHELMGGDSTTPAGTDKSAVENAQQFVSKDSKDISPETEARSETRADHDEL